jgi:hypothetical protein
MSKEQLAGPWAETGIPGRACVDRLLYNRTCESLVVVIRKQLNTRLNVNRLYFRGVADTSYDAVPVQHSCESQEDAACCEAAPFLIYNEMRLSPPAPRSSGCAADWKGIRRFNLTTGLSQLVLDKESLRPPRPYTAGWVSSIIAPWPDGSGAVCRVGLEKCESSNRVVMDYFVFEISFQDGLLRQIAALPRVFL